LSCPKELEAIALAPWASRRRQDLLDVLDQLTPKIQELTRALEEEVEKRAVTRRLMTHPGVGPLTALAYELVTGAPERFHCGKQIANYVGLVPEEKSSGDRRQLGHISKQGNILLRFLLVEAAQVTVRSQPEWRNKFFHLAMRRGRKIAKVAMARKLAVHLYWMWRQGCDYGQWQKLASHAVIDFIFDTEEVDGSNPHARPFRRLPGRREAAALSVPFPCRSQCFTSKTTYIVPSAAL
jgi:transposase